MSLEYPSASNVIAKIFLQWKKSKGVRDVTREAEIGICVRVKAKEQEEHVGAEKGSCQKLETPAANSNEHIEMDGSCISQLQPAAKFGEIGFPGTNQDFTLVVKGTTH